MGDTSTYFINSTLVPTSTDEGWVTTTSNPEIHYFRDLQKHVQFQVSNIIIEVAQDSPYAAKVCINSDNSYLYISQGQNEQLDDITAIHCLKVISAIGTKLKWKCLSSVVSGNFYEL